jgi:NAD(P)-dependent dehydrogenase (short-subunit alcohol dehydrogenase family)
MRIAHTGLANVYRLGVGRQLARHVAAKRWSCVFVARSGGRAQASFATKAEAKEFAERHARAFLAAATPLTWEDADGSSVLTTQLGEYLVTSVDNDALTAPRARS